MNAPPTAPQAESRIAPGVAQQLAIQQQLHYEARLLDEERFQEWLGLLCEDLRYVMPVAERRFRKDRAPEHPFGNGCTFDDTKPRLAMRVGRLESGFVWAEDPRNCVRRIVSNFEVYTTDAPDVMRVYSTLDLHRARMDGLTRRLTAARVDRWRDEDGQWRLLERRITLDLPVVADSNLNVFF